MLSDLTLVILADGSKSIAQGRAVSGTINTLVLFLLGYSEVGGNHLFLRISAKTC